jgi:hypothetical protein
MTSAKARWWTIMTVRLAGTAGALLGVALISRATGWDVRILGTALALSGAYVAGVVPIALAHRWRSGGDA